MSRLGKATEFVLSQDGLGVVVKGSLPGLSPSLSTRLITHYPFA